MPGRECDALSAPRIPFVKPRCPRAARRGPEGMGEELAIASSMLSYDVNDRLKLREIVACEAVYLRANMLDVNQLLTGGASNGERKYEKKMRRDWRDTGGQGR